MKQILSAYKPQIDSYLHSFLQQKEQELAMHTWATDVFSRLYAIANSGKTVRGSLVMFTCTLFGDDIPKQALPAAAAIELVHMSLLIHDDIQDRDDMRRGQPTLHHQYADLGKTHGIKPADHFGIAVADNVGVLVHSLAFELLATIELPTAQYQKIIRAYSGDLTDVAFAQIHDVFGGMSKTALSEEDILRILNYKTARYTFSLPFTIACILTNQSKQTIKYMTELGEYLGTIFQIKDDELGLFGDSVTLGKPVGSDIIEGKQTLFYNYLFTAASADDTKKLTSIFGNQQCTEVDIEYVRDMIKKYAIADAVNKKVDELVTQAIKLLSKLPFTQEQQTTIRGMIDYLLTRKK